MELNNVVFIYFLYVQQLCVWSTDGWEKQASKFLQMPSGRAPAPLADTRVQFHQDQTHLLAVHETQIAIYEAPKLECLKQVCYLYIHKSEFMHLFALVWWNAVCVYLIAS